MTYAFHDPYWLAPDWVTEGDTVRLPIERESSSGKIRCAICKVLVAAGNHARISIPLKGTECWVPLGMLLVAPDDPRHPNAREQTIRQVYEALNTGG